MSRAGMLLFYASAPNGTTHLLVLGTVVDRYLGSISQVLCRGKDHARGLVNLFGIESPGLTSSLAIAEEVVKMLSD